MALPVGLWLAFLVAATVSFRIVTPWAATTRVSAISGWLTVLQIWARVVISVCGVIGYLLAGALLLEDPLVGTRQFWTTRPIANLRLLTAKVLAAAVLFVAAPAVVLGILWIGAGATLRDVVVAAGAVGLGYGMLPVFAFMVASLSRHLAQFVLLTVALAAAYFICGVGVEMFMLRRLPLAAVLQSREMLVRLLPIPVAAIVLVQQYITRRPSRAWATIALALVACAVVRLAWPWSVARPMAEDTYPTGSPSDKPVDIRVTMKPAPRGDRQSPLLVVTTPWSPTGFYAPNSVRLSGGGGAFAMGAVLKVLKFGPERLVTAAVRVVGFDHDDTPLDWNLLPDGDAMRRMTDAASGSQKTVEPALAGQMEVCLVQSRVLGEMPLQEGAGLASGADRTRIVGLLRTGERLDSILVEERDVDPAAATLMSPVRAPGRGHQHSDVYVLVDRAAGRAYGAVASDFNEVRTVAMNGFTLDVRRIAVAGNDTWRGAVLVKVRFEVVRRFEQPFRVGESAPTEKPQ
jgi:hypothetical protein